MNLRAREKTPIYGLFVLACILLAGSGAFAMRQEFSTYLRTGTVIPRAAQVMPDMVIGLSANSMRSILGDCIGAMKLYNSLTMLYAGEETRDGIVNNCLATADIIAEQSPTLSIAWFTGAYASILRDDVAGFNDRLQRSQLTAPNEQWIVDMRVDLAENNLAKLDTASLAAHEHDLKLMVLSAVGLRNVARRWISDEAFRGRITDILETMPQDAQQRFVINLRRTVGNANH